MSNNRASRSLSPGRAVYREGVNLHSEHPESSTQAMQIAEGREAEREFLRSFAGRKNEVLHMGEQMSAKGLVDRFRVTSSAPGGFNQSELSTLMSRYPNAVEVGHTGATCFINIAHRRYDKRVLCFDLTRWQCLIIVGLLACIALLLFCAYDVDRFARFNDRTTWIARAVETKHVTTKIEI